jgi:hypothetical protein
MGNAMCPGIGTERWKDPFLTDREEAGVDARPVFPDPGADAPGDPRLTLRARLVLDLWSSTERLPRKEMVEAKTKILHACKHLSEFYAEPARGTRTKT